MQSWSITLRYRWSYWVPYCPSWFFTRPCFLWWGAVCCYHTGFVYPSRSQPFSMKVGVWTVGRLELFRFLHLFCLLHLGWLYLEKILRFWLISRRLHPFSRRAFLQPKHSTSFSQLDIWQTFLAFLTVYLMMDPGLKKSGFVDFAKYHLEARHGILGAFRLL